jgi:hypothetical protein
MSESEYPVRPSVRMTATEHGQLQARAQEAGLSLSRYLVESGLREVPPSRQDSEHRQQEQEVREWAITQLVRVGNNLNQIARQLNAQAEPLSFARISQVLDELSKTMADVRRVWSSSNADR